MRGLHFQNPKAQGKLVSVLRGEVFDVAVDVRRTSTNFGKWVAQTLSSDNGHQMYIPPGFAHGFVVMSKEALFTYKCTDYYAPEHEVSLLWNDPALGIAWPKEIADYASLSKKDAAALPVTEIDPEKLPR